MLPSINLPGGFLIHSYPFFLGISLAFFFKYSLKNNRKVNLFSSRLEVTCLLTVLPLIAFSGGRLFFQLIDGDLSNLLNDFFYGGGLVFYGGYICSFIFIYLYCRLTNKATGKLISFLPGVIFAHAIGRVGCFLAGCCHGNYCPLDFLDRWPTQLFEVGFLIALGLKLKKRIEENKKNNFFIYVLAYSVFRFLNEFLRGDEIRGIWHLGLSTSQIVSLVLFVLFGLAHLKETFSTNSSET